MKPSSGHLAKTSSCVPPVSPHDIVFVAAGQGPGAVRGQPINVNAPGTPQTPENMQQMKKLMEQELKSDKYKSNSNKGYVFTLMPLYAIGVGVFAAYKFLKVSKDTRSTKFLREFTTLNGDQ